MAKIKVGINGFGRIGRLVFRAAMTRNDIEIVGINDPDRCRLHGIHAEIWHDAWSFQRNCRSKDGKLVVNGQAIRVTAEKDPANLKWDEVGAEYVVESTGLFLTKKKLKLTSKLVRETGSDVCTFKDDTPMFVMGVNNKICRRNDRFKRFLYNQLSGSADQSNQR